MTALEMESKKQMQQQVREAQELRVNGSLLLEVTRNCNMRCAHCLRGPAERVTMSKDTAWLALRDVKYANCIVFTGGEPSIGVQPIQDALDAAQYYGSEIGSFYCASNCKIHNPRFAEALCGWWVYTQKWGDDEGFNTLALSTDKFHEPIPEESILWYSTLSFFDKKGKAFDYDKHPDGVLLEGMALQNGLRGRKHHTGPLDVHGRYEVETKALYINEDVYVNALGDILFDCDRSYASQAEYNIGCISNEPGRGLLELVRRYIASDVPLTRGTDSAIYF